MGSDDVMAGVKANDAAVGGSATEETQGLPDASVDGESAYGEREATLSPERRAAMCGAIGGGAAFFGALACGLFGAPVVLTAFAGAACGAVATLASTLVYFSKAARDVQERRESFERALEMALEPKRTVSFESLLEYCSDAELGGIAQQVHEALTRTHHHRLEAGWLRREMDTLADSKAKAKTAVLRKEATTDPLTQLVNRRGFEESMSRLFREARREGSELALLAIDLDKFKNLNDTHGHAMGDVALVAAGEVLRAETRDSDIAARIGGDELFLVLYGTDRAKASSVADRLAQSFSNHKKAKALGEDWPTMSVGVALAKQDGAQTEAELFQYADEALYASKRAGRSCATMYADLRGASRAA